MKSTQNIVVIGGGTGAPIVIKSLLLAGFSNLTVISAAMDTGGRSGLVRSDERDRVISISDTLRCLLALINTKNSKLNAFMDLIGFTDGRNRNVGHFIYYALLEKYQGNFFQVQSHLEEILDSKFSGQVIPITLIPTNIHFSTLNGNTYSGEHELDRQSLSANTITKIWLNPKVSATPEAVKAITSATHIIYSPGSIYGSILANFLPTGITSALKKSKAKKILITNLVSNRNQNHNFKITDYINIFNKYTQLKKPVDIIIIPDISQEEFKTKYPKIAARYALEHSHFLGWPETSLPGIQIIRAPIASITPDLHRLRHNPQALAKALKSAINL